MQDLSKIAEKVRKLDALAKGTNHPEEAASAAAKAQALILEYNLTRAQLEAAGEAETEKYGKTTYTKAYSTWRKQLITCVCKTNFCRAILSRDAAGKETMEVIGQASNIEMVLFLHEYIIREVTRMARESHRQDSRGVPQGKFFNDFCTGAVHVIVKRLTEQFAAQQAAKDHVGDQTRALVLVKDADLAKAVGQYFPFLTNKTWRQTSVNMGAYDRGRAAGQSLPLNRPISDSSKTKRIK